MIRARSLAVSENEVLFISVLPTTKVISPGSDLGFEG